MEICLLTLPHYLPQLNNTQNTPLEESEATALYVAIWCLPASDDESSVRTSDPYLQHHSTPYDSPLKRRAEPPSQLQHHMDYHHTSTPNTDVPFQDATAEEEEEDFLQLH